MESKLVVRTAVSGDEKIVLGFIKELAEYEKLSHEVVASEGDMHKALFEEKTVEALIAECEGKAIGFALFFYNFSTFVGKKGIYLEDLYIQPHMRGRGFGKKIFARLADIALERECGRLEWSCLDWNQSSIDFYKSMGARAMDEWTVYRLDRDGIKKLSGRKVEA